MNSSLKNEIKSLFANERFNNKVAKYSIVGNGTTLGSNIFETSTYGDCNEMLGGIPERYSRNSNMIILSQIPVKTSQFSHAKVERIVNGLKTFAKPDYIKVTRKDRSTLIDLAFVFKNNKHDSIHNKAKYFTYRMFIRNSESVEELKRFDLYLRKTNLDPYVCFQIASRRENRNPLCASAYQVNFGDYYLRTFLSTKKELVEKRRKRKDNHSDRLFTGKCKIYTKKEFKKIEELIDLIKRTGNLDDSQIHKIEKLTDKVLNSGVPFSKVLKLKKGRRVLKRFEANNHTVDHFDDFKGFIKTTNGASIPYNILNSDFIQENIDNYFNKS